MIQTTKTLPLFLCSVFILLISSVSFSLGSGDVGPSIVPGLTGGGFFIPGQGFQTFRLVGCDACPSPDALETREDLSNYAEENRSVVTLGATLDEQRLPVEDATVFVKVIYGEGGSNYCRAVTDSVGEADFVYEEAPYSTCFEEGCTVRFTFCCPNLTQGACLIKDCLGEPSVDAYNDGIPPCPGYGSMEGSWPLEATVYGNFYSLTPSINEFLIPLPVPDPLAGFSFGFCFPILVIFGLLSAAMFASGRNPFQAFSFYTPRFKRGTEKMIRGRGTVWNINSMVNTMMSAATAASRDVGAGKVQGTGGFARMKKIGDIGKKGKGKTKMAVGEGEKKKMTTTGGKDGVAVEMGAMEKGGLSKGLTTTGAMARQSWDTNGVKRSGGVKGFFTAAGLVTAGFVGGMGLALMQKMSYRFMPLTIVFAGGFGFKGLVTVIGESVSTSEAGSKAVLDSLNDDRKAMDLRVDPKDPNTIHFNDSNGNPQTMTFANTEEGQKQKAEKIKELAGELTVAIAVASRVYATALKENATETATDVTEAQLKNVRNREGVMGEHVKSVVAKYDTDGKAGISAKEFNAAMKTAKPEEMGALILAAPEKAIKGIPQAYVHYVKGQIESGKLDAKGFAEASLVLAKAEAAGVEFKDAGGFRADVRNRMDISKAAKGEVEAEKMTESEAISEHQRGLAEKEYYDAVMGGDIDTGMGDLANALAGAQAKGEIQRTEGDQALIAIGASACTAAGGGDGMEGSAAGNNLSHQGLVTLNDVSNSPAPKEPSKEFNEVMQAFGDRTDSGHPGNYVAAKEKQEIASEAVQDLVMYGAERGASYSEFDRMAMEGGFLSEAQENKVKALMRGELPTIYDNAWAATATSDDIAKAKEDIKGGKLAPDEQSKLEMRVGIAESASKKAEARRELQGALAQDILADNALSSKEYRNAYQIAKARADGLIKDGKLPEGQSEAFISSQMESKGFGAGKYTSEEYRPEKYKKALAYAESQLPEDKTKLAAAVADHVSGDPPGLLNPETRKKYDTISTDPQERRITELKQQQAAEVAAKERGIELTENEQKRNEYSAVASEWIDTTGGKIYANKKHIDYAEEQKQIRQEQDFKQQVAFGVAREWAGENKDKVLKTFKTEEEKQKYLEERPALKGPDDVYASETPSWGERFKQDLPHNKIRRQNEWKESVQGNIGEEPSNFEKYRNWEKRVHGGHEGSEYASRRKEFNRIEQEKSFMKRGEQAQVDQIDKKLGQQYAQSKFQERSVDYAKHLAKGLGLGEKPTTPFSQTEEKAMLESKKQRVETLKTEQKRLEAEHKEIGKQYSAPGANAAALDTRYSALSDERKELNKQQKQLEKQMAADKKAATEQAKVAQRAETEREERAKKAREEVAKFTKRKKKEGET